VRISLGGKCEIIVSRSSGVLKTTSRAAFGAPWV
jgi:hypothetical protein